eukprot:915501-Pleurochrysis_carterae.AAC.1
MNRDVDKRLSKVLVASPKAVRVRAACSLAARAPISVSATDSMLHSLGVCSEHPSRQEYRH